MAEFHGSFYIGMRNTTTGGQLWRSSNGVDFSPVFTDGLGKSGNRATYGIFVFEDTLYLVFNNFNGAEVWRSANGTTWQPVMQGGWGKGDVNAWADYFDKAADGFPRLALYRHGKRHGWRRDLANAETHLPTTDKEVNQ